jgi:hypothetical protein
MGLAVRFRGQRTSGLLRGCQYCAKKVKLCDDGHIAFAQSSLVLQTEGKGAAMRRALPIIIVTVLLTATVVDVVAAGVKTVAARRHFITQRLSAST